MINLRVEGKCNYPNYIQDVDLSPESSEKYCKENATGLQEKENRQGLIQNTYLSHFLYDKHLATH